MTRQVTVRIPDALLARLDRQAKLLRRQRSDVIRMAVESFLEEPHRAAAERPIDRVRELIGSHESGIPDLGQRHREHLLERLLRDR